MKFKGSQRQEMAASFRLIHSKNTEASGKRMSIYENQKSNQYFPARFLRKDNENRYLESSSATTSQKDYSEQSRGMTMQTVTSQSIRHENKQLKKQIQILNKQLLKFQKLALQRDDRTATLKQLESQLIETYRVIHYYEGKTRELERISKKYEQNMDEEETNFKGKRVRASQLLEQHRNQNIEIRIQLESKKKLINDLNHQVGNLALIKIQNEKEINNLLKQINENSKKRLPHKIKLIDDYEHQHLIVASKSSDNLIKKRPVLSKNKKIKKVDEQSSSGESNISNQYRSNCYLRRKKVDASSDRENNSNSSSLRATMFGNLSSKINNLEKELQSLKKENQRLQGELDGKLAEIIKLKTANHQLELKVMFNQQIKVKQQNQAQSPKKVMMSKDLLKQIPQPIIEPVKKSISSSNNSGDSKLSMFVSNLSRSNVSPPTLSNESSKQSKGIDKIQKTKKTNYCISQISEKTFKKLLVNIVKSELSYQGLINMLASCWSSDNPNSAIEELEGSPCELNSEESAQFMFEFKKILKYISNKQSEQAKKDMNKEEYCQYLQVQIKKVLEDVIPSFKNITFRREFTINIQLSNKFKNYENEFVELSKKYENKMPYQVCERVLLNEWGMSNQQFLCFMVKNKEESGDTQFIQFAELGKFYLAD